MAEVTERLIFDDSQAIPVLKNVSENLQKTSKDMQNLLDLMGKDAAKASASLVASEEKVNVAVIKTSLSMSEARRQLGEKAKAFGVFGITIGGGIKKLKEFNEILSLVRQGLIGNIKPTQTQAEGINLISDAIKQMASSAKAGFATFVSSVINAFKNPKQTITDFFDSIKTGTKNSKDFIVSGFQLIKTSISGAFISAKKLAIDAGSSIVTAFKNPKQTVTDLATTIKDGFKSIPKLFSNIGNGISSALGAGIKPAITSFVTGMNLVRVAILSTGIGALIIIIGSLIAYMSQTNEESGKISRAFAGMKAVVRVLTDAFAGLGGTIIKAFSQPKQAITDLFEFIKDNIVNRGKAIIDFFGALGTVIKTAFTGDLEESKKAIKDLGTSLIQFTTGFDKSQQSKISGLFSTIKDEANKAYEDGKNLFDKQKELYKRETELILKVANLRRQIADLRFVSKDENESYSARIKAAEKALILERELINAEVETAKARLAVIKEENRLKGKSIQKEDRRTEIEAVAAVQDAVSNASTALRSLNKTHQNLIQEAKKEFTSAVENLVEIRDQLIGTAKEFNLISDSKEQTYELQKQLDILNEQRNSIIAISTFFEVATGQNPFTKELELMDKLIERVTATIQRGGDLKPIDPISRTSNTKIKELNEELERLQTISLDLNVDTSQAQKEIQKQIDDLTKNPVQSTQKVEMKLEIIPPTQGDPLDKSFGESLDYILNDINDFINGLDDAEDLLNKALKGLFGNGADEARAFIGGLNEVYQAYSQIFQESSALQIEKNNEIIKQKEEQIQKLEDDLDKELELQELGLANNVGTKKEELTQLLAEQEKFEKENEELKKKAQKNQLIQDTLAQSSSIITSSINIIKGFSNIPIVGLPLGIAAVGALLTFFAATKAKAFAATKLEKGARRIDDHFGFVDRFGDSDKGAGQGYKIINARTGNDTNVRISGKEMLIPEAPSLIHTDFLYNLSKGVYNNVPLKEIAEHYSYLGSTENQKIINNEIINHTQKVINNTYNQKTETSVKKQWVQFEDKNGKGVILLELPEDKAVGSRVYFN